MSPSKEKPQALRQQRRETGKKLTGSALFLPGFCAGIAAHWLFVAVSFL